MPRKKKPSKSAPKNPKRRSLKRFVLGLIIVGFLGLAWAFWLAANPQDLSDIDGFGPDATNDVSRDLHEALKQSVLDGFELTITEEELNLYLRDTLAASHHGLLSDRTTPTKVAVRLEDGQAEIILVHELAGRTLTSSMYLQIDQWEDHNGVIQTTIHRHGAAYLSGLPKPKRGGRFGKLPVPEGFLYLSLPAFEALADALRDPAGSPAKEIDLIEEMSSVRIEDGKLVLDPTPEMNPPTILSR